MAGRRGGSGQAAVDAILVAFTRKTVADVSGANGCGELRAAARLRAGLLSWAHCSSLLHLPAPAPHHCAAVCGARACHSTCTTSCAAAAPSRHLPPGDGTGGPADR